MDEMEAGEALFSESADEQIEGLQTLINSGAAWSLEGSVGRAAMDAIEAGYCVLGEEPHRDYWGNRVPSRYEVEPGTMGSVEYAARMMEEREV